MVALLLLAACGGASTPSPLASGAEPPAECARADADNVIALSADNLEFDAPCLVATAGQPITVAFTNHEAVPHNVAVHREKGGNEIMRGDYVTGPEGMMDYEVPALEAGQYYFDCTVHPAMSGTLYVVEA